MRHVDLRGLIGKGAVHVDVDVAETLFPHQPVEDIENVLCPAHGKGRQKHVPSPLEGLLDGRFQFVDARFQIFVKAVPVRGFNHNIIGLGDVLRVPDYRVPALADIPGENDLLVPASVMEPQLEAGRSQDMPRVDETEPHPAGQLMQGIIAVLVKLREAGLDVLRRVKGLEHLVLTGPLRLLRLPLGILFLDMRRIEKDDPGQFRRRGRGQYPAGKAASHQTRYESRMVEVRMREKERVDLVGMEPERLPVEGVGIPALVHTAVHKDLGTIRQQMEARPRDLSCSTEKPDLHSSPRGNQYGTEPDLSLESLDYTRRILSFQGIKDG